DGIWSRPPRSHKQKGHAAFTAARVVCAGVQRRDRVSFATAGGSTHALCRANSNRALARLPCDISSAFSHGSGATDIARALFVGLQASSLFCRRVNREL